MKNESIHAGTSAGIVGMADQIRALCSAVSKIARSDLELQLKHHDSGISAIEHGVLRHLSRGVTSMAEISRLMGVAPSTLVYVVDGLTEKRLVRRVKDSEDRRREPLLLEKKGADLFARFSKMDVASTLVRSLGGMPEQNRRKLLDLLKELATGLKASERLYASEELLEASAPSAVSRFGARRNNKRREMKS